MKLRRVEVECYAGGRADERPRRVREDDRQHVVARLLDSSVEESSPSKARIHRYTVLTDEGLELRLICESNGDWYLEQ